MSTGRRLAKRSIIGTKVCAPGPDGLWYSGVIQDIKTSQSATVTSADSKDDACDESINETKYIVRFDFKTQFTEVSAKSASDMTQNDSNNTYNVNQTQTFKRNAMVKEFRESDLIGPGFRSINGICLSAGQRVYVTHNGRETSGDVLCHDMTKDEVIIKITPIGNEKSIKLKKRLEEVRLLESRRSARLAYHDRHTDFARLADMGGGERRRTPCSIDVPLSTNQQSFTSQQNSRKRPLPYIQECNMDQCDEEEMSECNAAMILVTLSLSPKSPKNKMTWFGSSPRSSSASWSSGSSSPPLSDDGHNLPVGTPTIPATARIRTTSVSTSDEGIVVDYKDDTRKGRISKTKFVCTYPRCKLSEYSKSRIERHIRTIHLSHKKPRRCEKDDDFLDSDSHEEEFYYTEIEDDEDDCKTTISASPPTLSHRDMARPPHEDPVYQRQIIAEFKRSNTQQVEQNNDKTNQNTGNHKQQLQNEYFTTPMVQQNYWHMQNEVASLANHHTIPTSHIYSTSSYYQHTPTTTASMEYSSVAPCSREISSQPSATYVQRNYVNQLSTSSENHVNSNSVLQQLSQQNVTIRAHRNAEVNNFIHQNEQQENNYQQQLQNVTITPNKLNNARATNCQTNSPQIQKPQRMQQQSSTVITNSKNISKSHNTNTINVEHLQDQNLSVHKTVTSSSNRRTRGENKKCRKVYGMDRRDMWCTQCRWKKACSRFGD